MRVNAASPQALKQTAANNTSQSLVMGLVIGLSSLVAIMNVAVAISIYR